MAGRIIIANALAPSMFFSDNRNARIRICKVPIGLWKALLASYLSDPDYGKYCVVGHPGTVELIKKVLGDAASNMPTCQRTTIVARENDIIFGVSLAVRLEPGKELDYAELEKLASEGKVIFWYAEVESTW